MFGVWCVRLSKFYFSLAVLFIVCLGRFGVLCLGWWVLWLRCVYVVLGIWLVYLLCFAVVFGFVWWCFDCGLTILLLLVFFACVLVCWFARLLC